MTKGASSGGALSLLEPFDAGGSINSVRINGVAPLNSAKILQFTRPLGEVTIQPVAASVTVTGGQPTVTAEATFTSLPTTAAVTVTGNQPGVVTGTAFSNYWFNAEWFNDQWFNDQWFNSASEAFPFVVQPTTGAVTVTGGIPSVTANSVFVTQPTAGAVTVWGANPVVTSSLNYLDTPTSGAVTVTGGVPAITLYTINVGGGGKFRFSHNRLRRH